MINTIFNPFPILITVGQALLILINAYQLSDPAKANEFKRLYLLGFKAEDYSLLETIKLDPHLSNYTISTEPKTTFKDPTRRYFETHFARETLNKKLEKLPLTLLRDHYKKVKKCFKHLGVSPENLQEDESDNSLRKISPYVESYIDNIFSGKTLPNTTENVVLNEYAEIFNRIYTDNLSAEQKEKRLLLLKCFALSLVLPNVISECKSNKKRTSEIPGEYLYSTGMFADDARGRKFKEKQKNDVLVHHLGLMLGTMPLSGTDPLFSETPFKHVKPSERSEAVLGTPWVEAVADTLVHTFSTSISGSMLLVLRIMMILYKKNDLVFKTRIKFKQYYLSMICLFLSITGGHSIYEFCAPLLIKDVQQAFPTIFRSSEVTLEFLLLSDNESALNSALQYTIAYNHEFLLRNKLNQEVNHVYFSKIQTIIKSNLIANFDSFLFLHKAIINGYHDEAFLALKNNTDSITFNKHLNYQNEAGETPLHLAAHEGLVGLVLVLLDAQANPYIINSNGKNVIQKALLNKQYSVVLAIFSWLAAMYNVQPQINAICQLYPEFNKLAERYDNDLSEVKVALVEIPILMEEINKILTSSKGDYSVYTSLRKKINDLLIKILTTQEKLISANQCIGFSDPFDKRSKLNQYAKDLKIFELAIFFQASPQDILAQLLTIQLQDYFAFTKEPLTMGVLNYNESLHRPQVYTPKKTLECIIDAALNKRLALDIKMIRAWIFKNRTHIKKGNVEQVIISDLNDHLSNLKSHTQGWPILYNQCKLIESRVTLIYANPELNRLEDELNNIKFSASNYSNEESAAFDKRSLRQP